MNSQFLKGTKMLSKLTPTQARTLSASIWEIWRKVRWQWLRAWHNKETTEIMPCMEGVHHFQGKKYFFGPLYRE